MLISEKLEERTFNGRTTKDAYLSCCKWLSSNVIALNNSRYVTYKIEKIDGEWNKSIKLTLYVTADEEEIRQRHCNICQEFTGNFYMKQNKYMCETCKLPPYRKRIQDKLQLIKNGMKGGQHEE